MTHFVVGDDRSQSTLFPERLDDYLGDDNPVRAIDAVVDELDLAVLAFGGVEPEATGRPAYHPATLLKIYVYGYLNRLQLSRRLELFGEASVAIDGNKFKAVNTPDRNFTQAKMQRRLAQIDESIARYLSQLDSADRQGESVPEAKITRLNDKIATLRQEIQRLNAMSAQMMQRPKTSRSR
ncbi:MAG: ISPsy6 transposase [Bradyrhizobium sp.]|nr:ISPsy6 transposase [Bradyrhizobium sp.]